MYRVIIVCPGIADPFGVKAAADIETHFASDRRHYQNVRCSFATGDLSLTAESDFDKDGLALQDEFSDCISAFLPNSAFSPDDGGELYIKSVEIL